MSKTIILSALAALIAGSTLTATAAEAKGGGRGHGGGFHRSGGHGHGHGHHFRGHGFHHNTFYFGTTRVCEVWSATGKYCLKYYR